MGYPGFKMRPQAEEQMDIVYEDCTGAPERAPMDALLADYYELIMTRIEALSGWVPEGRGRRGQEEFWREIDAVLPPAGRLVLARSAGGALIGCGTLKTIGPGKGELKRLFVRPEARGYGVGQRLVEMRIKAARQMGLKELLVDTLENNIEMRGLYQKLGFEEITSYPESSTINLAPELRPYMRFFRMSL